jgi:structure-specific recognition protein 1
MGDDGGPARTFGSISLAGQSGGTGSLSMNRAGFGWKARDHGRQVTVPSADLISLQWVRGSRGQQIRIRLRGGVTVRFEGFRESDHASLAEFINEAFGKQLVRGSQAVRGWSWGQVDFVGGGAPTLTFNAGGGKSTKNKANEMEEAFEVPIGSVANAQLSNKNELALDLHVDDTAGKLDEELVEMRFYIPDEGDAETLLNQVKARADTSAFAGESICSFKEVGIAVPRGRYEVDMFPNHIKMHGKSNDFKILYSSITRLFLLPKDDLLVSFVMSLDPPIRQGSTMYPHIVFNFQADADVDIDLAIEPEDLEKKYGGKLARKEKGENWRVFSKLMKHLSKSPLHVPKKFKTSKDSYAVRTALGANEGFLFFLESCCFFVNKPPTYIRYDDIELVEFKRMELERRFDLSLSLSTGSTLLFSNIDRSEFLLIFKFLETKQVPIENAEALRRSGGRAGPTVMMDEAGDSSESDDEDFDMEAATKAETKDGESKVPIREAAQAESEDEESSDGEEFDQAMDEDEVKDILADGDAVDEPKTKKRRK